jgi:hypothetical protein
VTATFMQLDHRHASLTGQRPEPALHLVSVDRLHRRPSSTTSQPYPPRTSTRRRTCCHIPVPYTCPTLPLLDLVLAAVGRERVHRHAPSSRPCQPTGPHQDHRAIDTAVGALAMLWPMARACCLLRCVIMMSPLLPSALHIEVSVRSDIVWL